MSVRSEEEDSEDESIASEVTDETGEEDDVTSNLPVNEDDVYVEVCECVKQAHTHM